MPNLVPVALTITFKDSTVAENYGRNKTIETLLKVYVYDFYIDRMPAPLPGQTPEPGACTRYIYTFNMARTFNDDPIERLIAYFTHIESVTSMDCWYKEAYHPHTAGGRIYWNLFYKGDVERQTWKDLEIWAEQFIRVNHLVDPIHTLVVSSDLETWRQECSFCNDEGNWLREFIAVIIDYINEKDTLQFPVLDLLDHFTSDDLAHGYAKMLTKDYPELVESLKGQLIIDELE